MELPFDKYTYRARLLPSLLTFVPLAFAVTAWFPGQEAAWKVLGVIFVSSRSRSKRHVVTPVAICDRPGMGVPRR